VQTEILTRNIPEMVAYGVSQEEAARFGLPCGGTLRLLVEPKPELAILEQLLASISSHQITRRSVNIVTGKSTLAPGTRNDEFASNDKEMRTTYGPRWRMVIIGAGQLSQYTADFAIASDFEVIVIDPRDEYAEGLNRSDVTFIQGMPDDVLLEIGVDPHTAVVALTHDPKLDDMALMEALKSSAFYVGALGSKKNTQKRKERLLEFDVSKEEVEKLHGPVGLSIGALTPPEIAVSILAEVIAVKYGVSLPKKG
jgi:xanthine dehydrogenase accessory factor